MKDIKPTDLTLDQWLELVQSRECNRLDICARFPTNALKNEYLSQIEQRGEQEIKRLLRCLLVTICGNSGWDKYWQGHYKRILESGGYSVKNEETGVTKKKNLADLRVLKTEYFKRLMFGGGTVPVWEGLTWTLDLLPHFAKEAVEGIDAYFLANCAFLDDHQLEGLSDTREIIVARFITFPHPQEIYFKLSPTEFEWLVEALYEKMGYVTEWTKPSADGGVDVIAEKENDAQTETLLIQCKRHYRNIGVAYVRELLGVVSERGSTSGVLISSSNFTGPATKLAKRSRRILLVNQTQLTTMLNTHLGVEWPNKMSEIFLRKKMMVREAKVGTQVDVSESHHLGK